MNKIIKVIDNETIILEEYKTPDAVFETNEYYSNDLYCITKEVIKPFELYVKNEINQQKIDKVTSYINILKNNLKDYKTRYKKDFLNMLDDIKEILGDKENGK
jgi:hypothetical protein